MKGGKSYAGDSSKIYAGKSDYSGKQRGFIIGLLAVSIGWGILSLIVASVYNRLTKNAS